MTTAAFTLNYNVGPFGQETTLPIPTQSNKISLVKNQLINELFPDYSEGPIYILFRVRFNGIEVYKNAQYDFLVNGGAAVTPSNPDAQVNVTSPTLESLVQFNYPSIQEGVNGGILSGTYQVDVKLVYVSDFLQVGVISYSNQFQFTERSPKLSYWYDLKNPKLVVKDSQTYFGAGLQTEFLLQPPLNQTPIVNTFTDVQEVQYTDFYTQANEVVYTVLITYPFSTFNIVNVQQAYLTALVYDVDPCIIFNCINELYNDWKKGACSSIVAANKYNNLLRANLLGSQILNGLGCNSEELSDLIVEFNKIAGCDCGCANDALPRRVLSSGVVVTQNIVATDYVTPINGNGTVIVTQYIPDTTYVVDGGITVGDTLTLILGTDIPDATASFGSGFVNVSDVSVGVDTVLTFVATNDGFIPQSTNLPDTLISAGGALPPLLTIDETTAFNTFLGEVNSTGTEVVLSNLNAMKEGTYSFLVKGTENSSRIGFNSAQFSEVGGGVVDEFIDNDDLAYFEFLCIEGSKIGKPAGKIMILTNSQIS